MQAFASRTQVTSSWTRARPTARVSTRSEWFRGAPRHCATMTSWTSAATDSPSTSGFRWRKRCRPGSPPTTHGGCSPNNSRASRTKSWTPSWRPSNAAPTSAWTCSPSRKKRWVSRPPRENPGRRGRGRPRRTPSCPLSRSDYVEARSRCTRSQQSWSP